MFYDIECFPFVLVSWKCLYLVKAMDSMKYLHALLFKFAFSFPLYSVKKIYNLTVIEFNIFPFFAMQCQSFCLLVNKIFEITLNSCVFKFVEKNEKLWLLNYN